ncbi:hypothetical protein BIW11_03326 [Tropilaelaps mercedesae]|uniref:Uncharacterized protein n=1 Tax=Tropilaelaps mercedesae TaxID=418985 RepID=A0A1V9XNM8_9ACAR|nr:hypothetical protein BIW11_03326 [Tropilaelaps mercedesae]
MMSMFMGELLKGISDTCAASRGIDSLSRF